MSLNPAVNDPEVLEMLYWREGLSMWEIAKRLDCSETTVYRRMQMHGIDRRGKGYNSTEGVPDNPVYFYTRTDGYEEIRHSYDGDQYKFYFHQLLAIAKGEDPHKVFSQEWDVHHENEIKWDNRPSNIHLMTKREHMKHHAEKSGFGGDRHYSDDELLGWIDAFVSEFGVVPADKDIKSWPGPSNGTYRNRFGTINKAVTAAGYNPRDKHE